jgi:DNA-binding transcriptional regulator YiaG
VGRIAATNDDELLAIAGEPMDRDLAVRSGTDPTALRTRASERPAKPRERELTLRELRQAKCLTQEKMAQLLGICQAEVSRLERRNGHRVSTLSSYVMAVGGKLRLVAEFPQARSVTIVLVDTPDDLPPKRS